jgi:hypothetical protein
MRTTFPRRTFLVRGATLAGGVALVPLSNLATAQTVPGELLAQMDRHILAFVKRPRGEHLRGIADALRALAAHEVSSGSDAKLSAALRARIRENGEQSVLLAEPNWSEFDALAKRYGLPADRTSIPWDIRKQTLDRLLQTGLAAEWRRTAGLFDRVAMDVDRRHLARRQVNECVTISNQLFYMEAMVAFACIAAIWICGVCCATTTAAFYAWKATAQSFGC